MVTISRYFAILNNSLRICVLLLFALLSACASTPETYQATELSPIANYALSLQGAPYHYGKASPSEGFDCSGFVQYVYLQNGVKIPRTVNSMIVAMTPVAKEEMHSGDLVFFNTKSDEVSHVGIYVAHDDFIHAPSERTGRVLVSSLKNNYWQQHFVAAGRP